MTIERFRFGAFEFDAASLDLRRDGVPIRLQSQPAKLLALLIRHADNIVSRDELRQAIWGDKTFVDFEGGLNFSISQIRSALQDDAAQPLYIRTVPKGGYQFIAPVHRISTKGNEPPRIEDSDRAKVLRHKAPAVLTLAVLVSLAIIGYRSWSVQSARGVPILAVLRFDNESADPAMTRFSDALTDNVVEQLTAQSGNGYRVIGNAQLLRLPRQERDLKSIGASLHAAYAVLGQIQIAGGHVRVLAHLVRLSDQTHIWVVRIDRPLGDQLTLESEVSSKIAREFSLRMSRDPGHAVSFPTGSD